MYGKTGTLRDTASLAGYVDLNHGTLIFAVISNGLKISVASARNLIDQVVLKRFPKLSGWRGYICGDPAIVKLLKKKLFLSGMASRDIYSDAFLPAAS